MRRHRRTTTTHLASLRGAQGQFDRAVEGYTEVIASRGGGSVLPSSETAPRERKEWLFVVSGATHDSVALTPAKLRTGRTARCDALPPASFVTVTAARRDVLSACFLHLTATAVPTATEALRMKRIFHCGANHADVAHALHDLGAALQVGLQYFLMWLRARLDTRAGTTRQAGRISTATKGDKRKKAVLRNG